MAHAVALLAVLLPALAALAHPTPPVQDARCSGMIAKPAIVPYVGTQGSLLVYLFSTNLEGGLDINSSLQIRNGRGMSLGDSTVAGVREYSTDRHGRQWLHVPLDLTPLPSGASRLTITLRAADGRELWGCEVKVVRAMAAQHGAVVVDNVKGHVVGRDGRPFFPFGSYIYGVATENQRAVPEMEAQFGMNWIAPYLSEAGGHSNETWNTILQFMDRCHEIGVQVHYDLHELATLPDSTQKYQLLKTEVTTVMNHPAVAAYYLADEPGGQGIAPELLEKSYDYVKSLDPNKPCTMVFCCVDPAKYINSYDIGMADPYPIPNSPPVSVALETAVLAATGKPFFIVPQAFGGGEGWERTPTPAEERVMTYVSVLTGATGIQYFVRSPHQFPYAPTAWSECRRLSLEFRELSSAILSGRSQVGVQPSVKMGVLAAGWEERLEGVYVVAAVNYLQKPVNVSLVTNVSYTGPATVLFENREVTVDNGSITDVLMAYGTAAYRFPPVNSTMVSPSNLLHNPSFEQVTSASSPDGAYLNVPSDPGSTYLTDTSVSVDGLHSLRLVTATPKAGFSIGPYPVTIQANTTYEFSFWAMSSPPALELLFEFHELSPTSFTVHPSAEWKPYSLELSGQSAARTSPLTYQLVDNGTAWLDLMQLIPKN